MIQSPLTFLLRHRRLSVVLALGWMGVISLLSAQSGIHIPDMFFQQDKALHSLLFATLGFFWSFVVMGNASRLTFWHVLVVTLVVTGYGGLDEFHQSFVPGRAPDILDLTADTVGGFASAMLMKFVLTRHARRHITTP